MGQGRVEAQVQADLNPLGQGAGFSPVNGLGLGLGLDDRQVADKVMSAFTGDATPVMALPSREQIATAVGTITAILPSIFCGTNVAELEDEFEGEIDDGLVTEFIVGHVSDFFVRAGAVALTFV